jgi:hypothetical protein
MGKKAKGKRAEEKKQKRKAEHTAKKALYESYAKQGRLKKSRRARRQIGTKLVARIRHAISFCGNPGCARCFPQFAPKKRVLVA